MLSWAVQESRTPDTTAPPHTAVLLFALTLAATARDPAKA